MHCTLQAAFLQIPNSDPVIPAGSHLYLHLDIIDSFRNPTACTQAVAVRMSNGTTFQQLGTSEAHQLLQQGSPLGSQAAPSPQGLVFGAEMLSAGPVMVDVCVDGVQLQCGWPRSVLVLPGMPSAAHCVVRSLSKVYFFYFLFFAFLVFFLGYVGAAQQSSAVHLQHMNGKSACMLPAILDTPVC